MGCTQNRGQKKSYSAIANQISYLMPDICRACTQAQETLYEQFSPIQLSPLIQINQIENATIYVKLENYQSTGSVKLRGAFHKIYKVFEKARFFNSKEPIKLVTVSTGNHSLACIEALRKVKQIKKFDQIVARVQRSEIIQNNNQKQEPSSVQPSQVNESEVTPTDPGPQTEISEQVLNPKKFKQEEYDLTIFCPTLASKYKKDNLEKLYNINFIQQGAEYCDAEKEARLFAQQNNQTFISPYNDIDVIGGYSTIGFELEQQFQQKNKKLDCIFVAVGGGAVISGIAIYLKYIKEYDIRIVGVQQDKKCIMYKSIQNQKVYTAVDQTESICDSTSIGFESSSLCFPLCQALIDDWILVSEQETEQAIYYLMDQHRIVVEGSAALGYAGCLKYISEQNALLGDSKEYNCAVVLGGSNIDMAQVQSIVDKYKK